jgi:flagellar hook-basal body complex protein FliE
MLNGVNSVASVNIALNQAPQSSQLPSSVSNFASNMLDVMKHAEAAAVGGITGQVPMQDVIMKVMEAERTFATAMAIRDKAVGAYLELSRMQI